MATIKDIELTILKPYEKHKQLSINESESLLLDLLELLSQTYCKNKQTLKYIGKFLTKKTYNYLIEERNLNKQCGYPSCQKTQARVRDLYSNHTATEFLRQHNPYDYLTRFCSKFHHMCSKVYELQLSDESLFGREGVHLKDFNPKNEITLLEELAVNDYDITQAIQQITALHIVPQNLEDGSGIEKDLLDGLSDMKIIENENPHFLGDLMKEPDS